MSKQTDSGYFYADVDGYENIFTADTTVIDCIKPKNINDASAYQQLNSIFTANKQSQRRKVKANQPAQAQALFLSGKKGIE